MSGSRFVVIDGKRYLWRDLLRVRQEQRKAAKKEQPTLFPLKEDCRPPTQKTASGRYEEPTLFERKGCDLIQTHRASRTTRGSLRPGLR